MRIEGFFDPFRSDFYRTVAKFYFSNYVIGVQYLIFANENLFSDPKGESGGGIVIVKKNSQIVQANLKNATGKVYEGLLISKWVRVCLNINFNKHRHIPS